jgi:hypothetical protein
MTKEELAAELDGNEYCEEITPTIEAAAHQAGLVIVFGASDDLIEFRGAIYDEAGCFEGGEVYIVDGELWSSHGCDHHGGDGCEYARKAEADAKRRGVLIKAEWGDGDYSRTYNTHIPHATFDVVEGKEKYCRGIVFSLADAKGDSQ